MLRRMLIPGLNEVQSHQRGWARLCSLGSTQPGPTEWVLLILPQSYLVILGNPWDGAPTYVFICLQQSVCQGVMTNMDFVTSQGNASKFAKLFLSLLFSSSLFYEAFYVAQRSSYVA